MDFVFKFAIEFHGRLNSLFFHLLFIVWYLHLELAASLFLPFALFLCFVYCFAVACRLFNDHANRTLCLFRKGSWILMCLYYKFLFFILG